MTINKSVSINATSQTTDGQAIAYFSANVSDSGTSSNMTIQNQDLYEANKLQVRKDKTDFDNAVYEVEDAQTSTTTAG
ncbi:MULTISPECIES: hypothetical protein [Leuconostoc]|uniref:Uncharacterized protein n=1 Tax=Leuconostoc mesenteroides subsp. mesenteroides (strain ATCC 8293 / DSM 20343 / BCRC 11652 / CCM 1803 / JCM 6124 / NCDO 523 / NBRC 100496 / NCIMB 8023 / NCTC 12954 / NRRL B-1118 / 37Y) TaxID=203120 RepID=Q03VP7_LEUMM|nr:MULTISPECIES: hypothetical protein [Leuconostoc]ABJ62725.1 hypothetical protein LEUM_1633 [Leuconostoc mesenteroides subsp. mesenteroides ATCC 8293]AHF19631.1 hypothetical protein LMES_1415 [Leuconostoc mesenteroides KFRI-MG]AWV38423.1 hypothetical protein CD198_07990 [Leuconostoc mesenteroides]KAA8346120.1 hypothetical protein FE411_08150 [Leuconostoc mesenteroides]MCT3042521.1 hypothetical protein [Leuconostoc mesenteroides]